ncbi:MAG: MerR family transcriptional regulator [Beijerinckiaceae bacterium]|nr:MerR family transcriptional regulator [Beijerinckiaceae bacterium]
MDKSADAFRTISDAADELDLPQHVLRFWETRFPQIKPLKRAGGRRYYRPRDIDVLRAVKRLLYGEGYTIKGVQRLLREQGVVALTASLGPAGSYAEDAPGPPEQGFDDIQGPHLWQDGCSGTEAGLPIGSQEAPDPLDAALPGDTAVNTSQQYTGTLALRVEDIARLRAALAELAACEDVLAAARSR